MGLPAATPRGAQQQARAGRPRRQASRGTPQPRCACWRPATRRSTTFPWPTSIWPVCAQTRQTSWCEFKGTAVYWDADTAPAVGWSYPEPSPGFEDLRGHVAFYPGRVDEATVDGERVEPQEGGFYGGWITSTIVGPFKGGAGTHGW